MLLTVTFLRLPSQSLCVHLKTATSCSQLCSEDSDSGQGQRAGAKLQPLGGGDGHCAEALGSDHRSWVMGFNRLEPQPCGLGKLQRVNFDPAPILSPKHPGILSYLVSVETDRCVGSDIPNLKPHTGAGGGSSQ